MIQRSFQHAVVEGTVIYPDAIAIKADCAGGRIADEITSAGKKDLFIADIITIGQLVKITSTALLKVVKEKVFARMKLIACTGINAEIICLRTIVC